MPFIRISIAGPQPTDAQITQFQARTTALMADLLGKRPEVTVVAVESAPASRWSVGGLGLRESGLLAQMEVFITEGTNSGEEKAAFIAAAYEMLVTVLAAELSPAYVVVHEIPGSDWGFDGKTQSSRRQAAQAL